MIQNSLTQSHIQMQQQSSWRDDPFTLVGTVKGVAKVSHAKALTEYAEELVYEYGAYNGQEYELTFAQLPEYEQNELSRLHLEATDRDASECVYGDDFSIDNKYVCALLAMLQDDCVETQEAFAVATRKNVILYYSKYLQEVIDKACCVLLNNLNGEDALRSHQDNDADDINWKKF